MSTKKTPCIGRDPLLYGSRACTDPRKQHSDLCERHARLIAPNQLINGVFYPERPEEDGLPAINPRPIQQQGVEVRTIQQGADGGPLLYLPRSRYEVGEEVEIRRKGRASMCGAR